jgi:hypothetical protein
MLEELFTLEFVSERLRIAPITLRIFSKKMGIYGIKSNGTLLFTEEDIVKIQEARRTCRSNSSRPAKAAVDTGASAALSKANISTRVQAFHHKPARKKSA